MRSCVQTNQGHVVGLTMKRTEKNRCRLPKTQQKHHMYPNSTLAIGYTIRLVKVTFVTFH